jgi:hypothetical protein
VSSSPFHQEQRQKKKGKRKGHGLINRKYRYMEVNLQQRRKGLEVKIPDIQQTLTVVQFLQNRRLKAKGEKVEEEELSDDEDDLDDDLEEEGKKEEPLKTLFELNDTLFAEAEVEETGEVGIWLGVSPVSFLPFTPLHSLFSPYWAGMMLMLGKHNVNVPPRGSNNTPKWETSSCKEELGGNNRRSRMVKRTINSHGSQFRKGTQRRSFYIFA